MVITGLLVIWCLSNVYSGKLAYSSSYGVQGNVARVWALVTLLIVIVLGFGLPQTDVKIYDWVDADFVATTIVEPTRSILILSVALQVAVVLAGPFLAVAFHGNNLRKLDPDVDAHPQTPRSDDVQMPDDAPAQAEIQSPATQDMDGTASKTYRHAVGSLMFAIFGLVVWPFAFAAVVLGHTVRKNIAESGGTLKGGGLAIAGLVIGYIELASNIVRMGANL